MDKEIETHISSALVVLEDSELKCRTELVVNYIIYANFGFFKNKFCGRGVLYLSLMLLSSKFIK